MAAGVTRESTHDLHLDGREYPVTRGAAILFGFLITVVVGIGAFSELSAPVEGFALGDDLTGSFNVPAVLTLVLLLVAAEFALLRGRIAAGWERHLWVGLAVVFAYMCLQEAIGAHDRLAAQAGIHPEALSLPIVIGGVVLWALALRGLRGDPVAFALWIAAAALWGLSQEIELVTLGQASLEVPLTLPEEAFEMIGSALFALAILRYLESRSVPWVIRVRES